MRLHGRLRDREFIRDLLVEKTLGQHGQHAHLLRGEAGEPPDQIGCLLVRPHIEPDMRWRPLSAPDHCRDRAVHGLDGGGLRDIARGTEFDAGADGRRVFDARNHDDRHGRILRTQEGEPGKTVHARHLQVQQHQIDLRLLRDRRRCFLERAGLDHVEVSEDAVDRLTQRAAKQWMIVGDDDGSAAIRRQRRGKTCRHPFSPLECCLLIFCNANTRIAVAP